ncbi:hypothetical protein NKH18_47840 [Streptomyces sp. M10(2022)]
MGLDEGDEQGVIEVRQRAVTEVAGEVVRDGVQQGTSCRVGGPAPLGVGAVSPV